VDPCYPWYPWYPWSVPLPNSLTYPHLSIIILFAGYSNQSLLANHGWNPQVCEKRIQFLVVKSTISAGEVNHFLHFRLWNCETHNFGWWSLQFLAVKSNIPGEIQVFADEIRIVDGNSHGNSINHWGDPVGIPLLKPRCDGDVNQLRQVLTGRWIPIDWFPKKENPAARIPCSWLVSP